MQEHACTERLWHATEQQRVLGMHTTMYMIASCHVQVVSCGPCRLKAWLLEQRQRHGPSLHSIHKAVIARERLTCRDSSDDEPQDAGHSLKDPAPVRDGCVGGLAASVLSGVISDLDGCCTIEG